MSLIPDVLRQIYFYIYNIYISYIFYIYLYILTFSIPAAVWTTHTKKYQGEIDEGRRLYYSLSCYHPGPKTHVEIGSILRM